MLKKTISYVDFDGEQREEDFYFNLTKAEIAEMELSTQNGLEALVKDIIAAKNHEKLVTLFKDLVLRSYGVKSDDGRRFIKTPQIKEEFAQTAAYSELFMELVTDDKAAAAFFNGIVPKA